MQTASHLCRNDDRIIIHFDYDCFYASVVENENPALKSVPLAIQQKQIVVTCNYEARRRGLHKLQLITEAKKICPDVVIVLGEDISRFRDASKELCRFLTQAVWSGRAEKLGFDEVWLDCTDMIEHNLELLNHNDLEHSFFFMNRSDPTIGFVYDASVVYGCTYPKLYDHSSEAQRVLKQEDQRLNMRLALASHLARYLRHELEHQYRYTATVGIATNKLVAKLVGNVNKPKNQTTMMAPYEDLSDSGGTILEFMDSHDIGKIPGIGFKLAQKVRAHVLGHPAAYDFGLVYGGTRENVTVRDVRCYHGMGPELLEQIFSGPGSQKGIGGKIWSLLHGIDDSEVGKAKRIPSQISQEDSYMKYLHNFDQVRQHLFVLADRLIKRMHIDLTEESDLAEETDRRWLAHPRTLRLSTRPRPPMNADGTRSRTFHRISRSAPMPNFVFSFNDTTSILANKLVEDALLPMFRKLHPQRVGWNISLINIAVTNMAETAADSRDSQGRDIGVMFKRQDEVLRDFKITEHVNDTQSALTEGNGSPCSDLESTTGEMFLKAKAGWHSDEEEEEEEQRRAGERSRQCRFCKASIPLFAADAHERYHVMSD